MASRKVVKKSVKKTAVKKVVRSSRTSKSVSSKGLFQQHKNLKWLLPLLAVLIVALFVVHHYMDEATPGEGAWKQDVRNAIHLNQDDMRGAVLTVTPSPTDSSTITPFVTAAPTAQQ